jgi:uncharacterized membrane protein YidH (DUF202 family)
VTDTPWDPGMQNERTRLAWQRTILSGLACSLLVSRLLASTSLALAIAIGLAAVLSSAALGWFSIKRYTDNHLALHADAPTASGRSHLVIVALVTVTAAGAAVYVTIQ